MFLLVAVEQLGKVNRERQKPQRTALTLLFYLIFLGDYAPKVRREREGKKKRERYLWCNDLVLVNYLYKKKEAAKRQRREAQLSFSVDLWKCQRGGGPIEQYGQSSIDGSYALIRTRNAAPWNDCTRYLIGNCTWVCGWMWRHSLCGIV